MAKGTATISFTNENGKEIVVKAEADTDSKNVSIEIIGPGSRATNLLTHREAEVLCNALAHVLGIYER